MCRREKRVAGENVLLIYLRRHNQLSDTMRRKYALKNREFPLSPVLEERENCRRQSQGSRWSVHCSDKLRADVGTKAREIADVRMQATLEIAILQLVLEVQMLCPLWHMFEVSTFTMGIKSSCINTSNRQ